VNASRTRAALSLTGALGLAGCFTSRHDLAPQPPAPPATPPPVAAPPTIPDAVPKIEPLSRYGNPPYYEVFGKRYYVLSSSVAYVERGVASWYGPGFHQVRTSNGETYDMYAMTAAHKTLPLPAYVRVTNLENGRSVVVRVNDRGPFVGNRIIDLSYTAASRLDMLRNGTAMVEVRGIDPRAPLSELTTPIFAAATPQSGQSAPAAAPAAMPNVSPATPLAPVTAAVPGASATTVGSAAGAGSTAAGASTPVAPAHAPLFVQAGAFADPANAERLAAKLRGGEYGKIFVRDDVIAGRRMYRVRIGPVPNVPEFDRIVAALERVGVHDAHLALD
jgi:peptidoglycan lytic transglycosylase